MHIEGATGGIHLRSHKADTCGEWLLRVGISNYRGALADGHRRQALLIQWQANFLAVGTGEGEQHAARLHQITGLYIAALHQT